MHARGLVLMLLVDVLQDVKHFIHFLEERQAETNDSLVEAPTQHAADFAS